MEVIHARCAGLDVHKNSVVACARLMEAGAVQQEVESFETTTEGLLKLAAWLEERAVTHVAMEATGVYWKPVWHILEGSFSLLLANAMHIKNVPGRKSDVNDATWIADLLAHGLVRGSFVPPPHIQAMRDLTRSRKQLVREVAQHTLRIQKVLEDANLKLSSVLTDTLGESGRAILTAIVGGETDVQKLANLAQGRAKSKHEALVKALKGRVTDHHRFMLKLHLEQIDALQRGVRDVEARMGDALQPFRAEVDLLKTMPGISEITAHVIAAEVGLDMSRFPTAGHLLSWAGLCPRMDESAGKRKSTRIRKGGQWLKTTLVQAAWAASRKKDSYLQAQFHRLRARRGAKKAIIAVAASMLTAAYHMLKNGAEYSDLGNDHFDRREKTQVARRLIRRLENLGLHVEVRAAA